jgi:hypothetical protein
MAKLMQDTVSKLQERFDREQVNGLPTSPLPEDPAALAAVQNTRDCEIRAETDGSLKEIVAWYQLLIQAGNAVFEIEHWSRKLPP